MRDNIKIVPTNNLNINNPTYDPENKIGHTLMVGEIFQQNSLFYYFLFLILKSILWSIF